MHDYKQNTTGHATQADQEDQARRALARLETERDQQPDAYWVGYLKAELLSILGGAQ